MKRLHICILLLAALFCSAAIARASCGAASCPLNNHRQLRAGWISLGFSHEYINQDRLFAGTSLSFVGAIPGDHDEVQTINERDNFSLQYGIADRLGLTVDVPFVRRQHAHIAHDTGADLWESWNFSGLGDLKLSGEFVILEAMEEFQPAVSLTYGVKLPTGVTGLRNENGEKAEVTIQPGTGSTDHQLGLHYRQTIASVPSFGGMYSALPLIIGINANFAGTGTDDYRFGNSLLVHVGTAYQCTRNAGFLLQFNGRFQRQSDAGLTGEPPGNTGGTWIFASPGVGLQLTEDLSGSAYVQIPVYQNVRGIQQTARYNLSFSLAYNFSVSGS